MATKTTKLGVEKLEDREVFAGNVAAWVDGAGTLQVSGDGLSNDIDIREVGFNTLEVRGYTTTVNGWTWQRFNVWGDRVNVNLNNGHDRLTFNNGYVNSLNVNTGWGSDTVYVNNTTVYGSGNSANLTLGTEGQVENDNLYLLNDQFFGNLYTATGAGNDYMSIENTRVNGWLSAYGGSGTDTYRWRNSSYGSLWAWSSLERSV